MRPSILITGFASVTAAGVVQGLPEMGPSLPTQLIAHWPTPGPRRAYLVPPFRAADVVPGLRTRRMDRLSVWALVSSALVFQSARIEIAMVDADRTGVVFGTALGCVDRTQEFLAAVAQNAAKADPILFPETLPNLVAGHVARTFGVRGPNLTVMAGALSGENAMIEAAALLDAGAADRVLVLSGDCLTRPVYEFQEAKGMLDPACFCDDSRASAPSMHHRVPGEGLVACLLETDESAATRDVQVLGRYLGGWVGRLDVRGSRQTANETVAGVLAWGGPVVFDSAIGRIDDDSWLSPGERLLGLMTDAPPPLTSGSRIGLFGGAGLWSVGDALTRARVSGASAILATNADPCRAQASAIALSAEVCP